MHEIFRKWALTILYSKHINSHTHYLANGNSIREHGFFLTIYYVCRLNHRDKPWRGMFYKVHFILLFEKHFNECNKNMFIFSFNFLSPSYLDVSFLPVTPPDTSLTSITRGFHLGRVLPLWEYSNWQTSALVRHHSLHLHRYEKCFNKHHWALRCSGNCIPMANADLVTKLKEPVKFGDGYVDVLVMHLKKKKKFKCSRPKVASE